MRTGTPPREPLRKICSFITASRDPDDSALPTSAPREKQAPRFSIEAVPVDFS